MKKRLMLAACGAVVMMCVACGVWLLAGGAPCDGMVKVRRGSSVEVVCDSLASATSASYASRVKCLLRLTGSDVSRRQGAFKVKQGMSVFSAMRMLRSGAPAGVKFTFNNVRTLDEWCARWGQRFMVDADTMRAALADTALCARYGKTPTTIACLLIPDSYEFYWDITPEQLLDRMKGYYDRFWTAERQQAAQALGLTPDEVVIIASIVEEETAKRDERGKVARLYLNRIHTGMPLQADPTVKFALGDFGIRRLSVAMLRVESPYNTYRVAGLPPGPIRLPEKATIDAVLHAPQHNYIYMCAREDFSGYHNFTASYAEHNANANRYRAALNDRGIKR